MSGGPTQDGRPGTGHGRPAGQPARRRRPGPRGTGHPGPRCAAAGRCPGRGRPGGGGSPRRADRRFRRLSDHYLSDHCQPYGGRSSARRPSAGRRRACGREWAGCHSRLRARFRPPATRPPMTCGAPPCRPGENRRGTWPAGPTAEFLYSAGHRQPVRRPFRGGRQIHGRHSPPARPLVPGKLPVRGTCLGPVRHPLRCSARDGLPARCRSPRHRSPGSANRTLPGHAGRAPRRAGLRTCWRGGPCFRRRRTARHQPGLRYCRQPGPRRRRAVPHPCRWRRHGPWRRRGRDQRRRRSVPGPAVLRRTGSGRALRRRIARRPGPVRLPRSVLRSS
jgi:hypothetical protein